MITLYELLFEVLNPEELASGGKYIGIELQSGADELLSLPEVKNKLEEGWQPLAKHISIVPPPLIGGLIELIKGLPLRPKDLKTKWAELGPERAQEFAGIIKSLYGKPITITATDLGVSNDAIAVKVSVPEFESFPPLNAFRHVTIAIPPGGKAMNSNNITNWKPLDQQISLTGIIKIL